MHICQHAHPRNGPVWSVMDNSGAYGMGCHVTFNTQQTLELWLEDFHGFPHQAVIVSSQRLPHEIIHGEV